MEGKTINELTIGQKASFQKTISESDVYLYAGITGDQNPAHINEVYASQTRFKKRIVHGILTGSLISATLGVQLPGPGTIYLEQTFQFKAPTQIGDTVEAIVEVREIIAEKNIVKLQTTCVNQDGVVLLQGMATVMPPRQRRNHEA